MKQALNSVIIIRHRQKRNRFHKFLKTWILQTCSSVTLKGALTHWRNITWIWSPSLKVYETCAQINKKNYSSDAINLYRWLWSTIFIIKKMIKRQQRLENYEIPFFFFFCLYIEGFCREFFSDEIHTEVILRYWSSLNKSWRSRLMSLSQFLNMIQAFAPKYIFTVYLSQLW